MRVWRRARRQGCAVALLGAVALIAALVAAGATPAPGAKAPISIRYSGTFDLSNKLVPQSTPSSYTYHVEWVYYWSGRWGQLFKGTTTFKGPTPWAQRTISGLAKVTFRKLVNGANLRCTIRIIEDPGFPPTFSANYDTSAGTLQLMVEAPTFRGAKLVPQGANSSDPGCVGGPSVNVFGAPKSFNPLGQGDKVGLKTGGTRRFDRDWKWTYKFASGKRTYVAKMRSELAVVIKR